MSMYVLCDMPTSINAYYSSPSIASSPVQFPRQLMQAIPVRCGGHADLRGGERGVRGVHRRRGFPWGPTGPPAFLPARCVEL